MKRLLAWLKRLFTSKPVNHVDGVVLPAVDDPRWFPGAHHVVEFQGAHLAAHVIGWEYSVWYWLMVDGVKWESGEAQAYAREVIQGMEDRQRKLLMDQSRNYARQTFKAN